jgi:hypothetical protein
MADKSWKAYERRISRWFPGATRRGAHTGDGESGRNDIICKGWSIECKLHAYLNYQKILDAVRQAEANKENYNDIPIAIVKRKGSQDQDKDSLVVMRLETFSEFFI